MKKIFITVAAALLSSVSFGQSNYLSFQGGYHLGYPADNLTSSSISYAGTKVSADGSTEAIFGTLGKGVPLSLAFGHMFNENIGVELGASYLFGSNVLLGEDLSGGNVSRAEASTSQFRLSPQLVGKYKGFYSKIGFIIPVFGKTTLTTTDPSLLGTIETESAIEGHLSLGFTGAIGYEYQLNDKLSLFGEFQVISLNIKAKSSEFTKFDVDGVDQLDNLGQGALSGYSKETNYVKTIDANSAANDVLTFKRSYSSMGLNIGITYTL
ncbi:hypothetical protein OAH12_00480 [Cyclobacteriaceae bacterium]|nr:hypothetical protein [Cyclobacteriaceae bacterium]